MTGDDTFGRSLPRMRTSIPGPRSLALAERLGAVESRNVTYLGSDFPVFWEEASGANVRDVDGNLFLDLTGAFGVALTGHADSKLTGAVSRQSERLVHGMGDVHPPSIKVSLLERLAAILPWSETRTFLASSGTEAVEAALKTALLATGGPGILSFEGGYHGLTLGSLAATARREFRAPFAERLYGGTAVLPFPDPLREAAPVAGEILDRVEETLDAGAPGGDAIGAVVVEPVQGRAGVRIPPEGFFGRLGAIVREAGALLVADEIFTGLGRTGAVLASHRVGLEPDLVCLGKALGGGFPLSACAGPAEVMDAWPASTGEALHTSTFLGHPATAAGALAFLDRLEEDDVPERAADLGARLLDGLQRELGELQCVAEVRGLGLMIGIELVEDPETLQPAQGMAADVAAAALRNGILVLPAGEGGHVVELTPPVVLTPGQVDAAVEGVSRAIREVCTG